MTIQGTQPCYASDHNRQICALQDAVIESGQEAKNRRGAERSADCYLKILILSQRLEFMFSNSRQGLPGWPRQATLCQAGGAASRCDPDHDAIGLPVLPAAHTVVAFCCLCTGNAAWPYAYV
jgi:hypothetical protein